MYVYLYDEELQDRRYERDLGQVETRLTDLGITGKIVRLAMYRDPMQVMRDEIRAGATTLVAVGSEATLRRAIEAVGDTRVVVAYIPLGKASPMADLLGIPTGVAACDVLSARLVEDMDLGEVNGRRFLFSATMDITGAVVRCEDRFTLTPLRKAQLEIRNLAWPDDVGIFSPSDERLTFVVKAKKSGLFTKKYDASVLNLRRVRLYCPEERALELDGAELRGQEFDVRVVPGRLRVVTGKNRKYLGT